MTALVLVISLISGLYPAWHLSAFNPAKVMRSNYSNNSGKGYFRNILVIFQLIIAVGVITTTLIIFGQFHYLLNKERGYDPKNLFIVRRPDGLMGKLEAYKDQVRRHPGVITVTNSTSIPGGNFSREPYYLEGTTVARNYSMPTLLVSYAFDSAYRFRIKEGRFFSRSSPTDSSACVINETAASLMGLKDPVGKNIIQLTGKHGKMFPYRIIGVVRNFHFETLDNPIHPLVMRLMPGNLEGYLSVRLTPENQDSTINYLKSVWESYTSAYPFVCYSLDQDRKSRYMPVRETGRVFVLLSVIAVLISSLGLFALASFNYYRRNREIGLQKAMGASNAHIILQKIAEVLRLTVISSLVAWIGAFFLVNSWLNDYAFHIQPSALYFLSATGIVLAVSLATIYYHAWLSSRTNPGVALKCE